MLTRKLPCPSCGVGLKVAEDLPAGKKITCPKCGVGFAVPEGNGQAPASKEPAVRVRKPVPQEPDEYGEQDEIDNEEEAEERPVVRKRRPPPPEDEDEPEEEEEEERPLRRKRRKFKKKKQASRMPLILGLVIGGVLLLGAAGVTLAFVLWPKDNKSDSTAQNVPPSRPSRMPGGGPGGGGTAATDEKAASSGQEPADSKSPESGSDNASDQYAAGKQVFQRSCAKCHRLSGVSAGGRQAPDLSTIGREHDAEWLTGFIRDPKSKKPDSRMRPVRLSDQELQAVAAYLASLK